MRVLRLILLLIAIYAASYLAYRTASAETWDKDGRTYVIYPTGLGVVLYYLWRPLAYVDSYLTNTGAHIGPHQE